MSTNKQFTFQIVIILAYLLLTACSPATIVPTQPFPTATSAPTAVPTATTTPVNTAVPTTSAPLQLSLNTGSLASAYTTETVAAVSANENAAYWEVLPEYNRFTLQDYPVSSNFVQPQIFIYPLGELGRVNAGAGKVVTDLQTLLEVPQEITTMPYLPLTGDMQMMHAHIQYLDFMNGKGLRYLTQYGNGISPINNASLIYTYQGITNDGRFYVAVVLPVHHPSLPADAQITGNEPPDFLSNYPGYRASVGKALNAQAASTFAPDLTQLDAMMSSIEVK